MNDAARRLAVLGALALLLVPLLPACTATANVSDLWTSPDQDGARRRNVFFTDSKAINCIAELGIGRDDVTFEMYIRVLQIYDFTENKFLDTNIVSNTLEVHPTRTTSGPLKQTITLKAKGPDGQESDKLPLPASRAQCEAYLDGNLEKTTVFNVDFPPCPTAAITPGTLCLGFYKEFTECKIAGDTGDPKLGKCKCEKKGWNCNL